MSSDPEGARHGLSVDLHTPGGATSASGRFPASGGMTVCAIASFDNGFDRFDGVEWFEPTASV